MNFDGTDMVLEIDISYERLGRLSRNLARERMWYTATSQ